VLVRTHAQTVLLAEALRESGIPHRIRGGAAFLDRPEVRRTLRELRDATVPLGTALADIELALNLPGTDEDGDDDPETDALLRERRVEAAEAIAALLRMGQDYLRLDPLGRADAFARWLTATVQSEGDAPAGGDAIDLSTFHAAKGLEWVVVHLAGVEEGYVPISHARTAAARAEEARLLYVAMTRAQRELRITWAEHRTFASKVMERRPSPLLDPIVAARRLEPAAVDAVGPISPPVEGWADEVAQQRAALDAIQHSKNPGLEALHRWRDAAARAARVEPDAVLPDHVLVRVAAAQPGSLRELGAIRGVGTILASRLGPAMLEALQRPPADASTSQS
jgi:DNA helicase-2/ATP-dependent DNA helicase PcrA